MKRKKRSWGWKRVVWVCAMIVLLPFPICHIPIGRVKIEVGRETTYITGPLNSDGTVDYVAALDAMAKEGVTEENNAAPLLLKAFGEQSLPADILGKVIERLNLKPENVEFEHPFVFWNDRPQITPRAEDMPVAMRRVYGYSQSPNEGPSQAAVLEALMNSGYIYADVETWLSSNEEALALVEQASQKERIYVPVIDKEEPQNLGHVYIGMSLIRAARFSADALALRALVKSEEDIDGAWQDCLTMHRIARLYRHEIEPLSIFSAFNIDERACDIAIKLAADRALSPEKGRAILQKLQALPEWNNVDERVLLSNRLLALDYVQLFSRGGNVAEYFSPYFERPGNHENLDWNLMMRVANEWSDRRDEAMRHGSYTERQEAMDDLSYELRQEWIRALEAPFNLDHHIMDAHAKLCRFGGWPFRGRLSYIRIIQYLYEHQGIYGYEKLEVGARLMNDMENLAIALRIHHEEHGVYPERLEELVPGVLEAVPMDRFSGKELVYERTEEGYRLYSVGPNLKDDGGRAVTSLEDDLHVEVPRKIAGEEEEYDFNCGER